MIPALLAKARHHLGCFDESIVPLLDGLHFHTLCQQNSDDLEATVIAFEERFGKYLTRKWLIWGIHHITAGIMMSKADKNN